jgi:capsular polysaccharide biosynthesis protein
MGLRDLVGVLTRRLWLLIVGALLPMAGSTLAFLFLTTLWPRYEATATVIIGSNNLNSDWAAVQVSNELAPTYVRWATQRPVLQGVIDALSLPLSVEELQEGIDVRIVGDTQLMEISATSSDAQQAAAIANEIVRQLEIQVTATSTGEDDLPLEEKLVQMEARISAAEAELITLNYLLANYRPTPPGESDIARLETRISDTEAKLVALTDLLLETDSTTEADLLTRRINVLHSNLDMWREELDTLYTKAESDSEAEISQLVRHINALQSNLETWQREYSDLRAIRLVVVDEAQPRVVDPLVNILVAGMTGLSLTVGAILVLTPLKKG